MSLKLAAFRSDLCSRIYCNSRTAKPLILGRTLGREEEDSRKPIRGPRGVRSLAYLALDEIATKLKSSKSRICKARCVSVTRGVLFYSVFL